MKKVILVLLSLGLVFSVYGAIQKNQVERKLGGIIKQIKDSVVATAISLGNLNQEGKDMIQDFGSEVTVDDKTKLVNLGVKIDTAKIALDDLNAYIVANWSSIK